MAVALVIAATAGSSLAILAALDLAAAPANVNAIVQGHGRIQVVSFAAVFVLALLFEFIVRLNQRPSLPIAPRVLSIALVGAGAAGVAAGQIAEGGANWLMVSAAAAGAIGAVTALALVLRVRPAAPIRADAHWYFFVAAVSWLLVASLLTVAGALDAIRGVLQGSDARAMYEVLLRGFILNTIVAVTLRAVPGHLGVPPVPARRQLMVLGGVNLALLAWVSGSGAAFLAWSPALMRTGDLLLAVTLLVFAWWSGVLQAFRLPGRGFPRYQTLIPLAWLGAITYAVLLLGFSVNGLVPGATGYQEGAVRHAFLLGFMVPLMFAFAHIVLGRFGTGAFPGENWMTLAFVLVFMAWPLRVIPALLPGTPGDGVNHAIAMSGGVTAVAFALAAGVCAATAVGIRRHHRQRATVEPGAICATG